MSLASSSFDAPNKATNQRPFRSQVIGEEEWMRSVLFWEWKRLQRAEWWYVLFFIPVVYMMFKIEARVDYPPFASGAVNYFMGVAMASIFLLALALSPRNRPSDLPYVLSRPQEASRVWPIRLMKLFVVMSTLALVMVGGGGVIELYAHDNQFSVGGCEALYQYDKAGFTPTFSDERERATYSEFRAKRTGNASESDNCKQYGLVQVPGVGGRVLVITLLSVLLLSAAAVTLLATGRSAFGDRARKANFWLALVPSLFAVAMYVRLLGLVGSERRFTYDGPLVIYQATPWLVALLVAAATFYLILAHRSWKRIEVLL
jgi:hypothetical protein